jgi:polysaccharide deacetylase 2 family uncharacterized protein YibQ
VAQRRGTGRRKSARKRKGLGPRSRLPRFLRLGMSPAAALVSMLGVGVLIGIALAYHLLQPRLDAGERRLAQAVAAAPAEPLPPRVEVVAPAPPREPERSPFAPAPKAAQTPPVPAPNAGMAPPSVPHALPAMSRTLEPALYQAPPPAAAPSDPAWRRYAIPAVAPAGRPLIAVLIDDVGVNRRTAPRVAELPAPVTIAYMTYADNLPKLTAEARARGHELMLHVPMEPMDQGVDAGPNALLTGLDEAELRRRLDWGLGRFEGYVGVNNHMGSRFTAWEPGMDLVMAELRRRGLLFVDSRTIAGSVAARAAERHAVPHADRDVFLDNEQESGAVHEQLARLEQVARERGTAIGIGHPHDGTIAALAEWLPTLEAKGFAVVPVSAVVERRTQARPRSAAFAAPPPS